MKNIETKTIPINETKRILEKSFNDYYDKNASYYNDVLIFMNTLYEDKATSILKIKFKKITLNNNVFTLYNAIIKKYNINKDLIDGSKFDYTEVHDFMDIIEIATIMCNNLLEKLNYNIDVINYNNKKKLRINIINNGY